MYGRLFGPAIFCPNSRNNLISDAHISGAECTGQYSDDMISKPDSAALQQYYLSPLPNDEGGGEEDDEVSDELCPEAEPPHQHLRHVQVAGVGLDTILKQVQNTGWFRV